MNVQKLNRSIVCLYSLSAIKLATAVYFLLNSYSIGELSSIMGQQFQFTFYSGIVLAVFFSVFSFFIAEGLKTEKLWAWISALSLCLMALPSFALPAALIGLLTLLDLEVRGPFVKQFDFKF